MARRAGRGVSNVMQNLAKSVERGDYYEAHQMYRTVYFRSMTQKQYEDAIGLLLSGALLLLDKGQQTSGGDLAVLLVETYADTKLAVDEKALANLIEVFQRLAPDSILRTKFMKGALSWSRKYGPNARGDPLLHFVFGLSYIREDMAAQGQAHLVHAGEAGIAPLADSVAKSAPELRSILLARIVLQYLSQENIRLASLAFKTITDKIPSLSDSDVANFLRYLLQAVTRDAAALFKLLRQRYSSVIAKDPSLDQLLDKIGKQIFNIAPAGPGGLLGNLMKSFMGGMDFGFDGDDDDSDSRALPASSGDLD